MVTRVRGGRQTWYGHWWLPGEGAVRVPGHLERDDGGAFTLHLVGSVSENLPDAASVTIIHGLTNQEEVTLLNSFELLFRPASLSSAPVYQKIRANRVLFGMNLEAPEAPQFISALIEVENLMPFLYPSDDGVEFSPLDFGEGGSWQPRQLTMSKPPTETFVDDSEPLVYTYTASTCQVSFEIERTRSRTEAKALTVPQIRISSSEPVSLAEFDKRIKAVMDLLTIASGQACGLIRQKMTWTSAGLEAKAVRHRASLVKGGFVAADDQVGPAEEDAEVIGPSVHEADADGKPQHLYRFAFTCEHVDFAALMSKWLPLSRKIKAGLALMLAQTYARQSFLETNTMEIAAAAESIHRGMYGNISRPIEAAEFKTIKETIEASIPAENWAMVSPMLRNEPTFADRLRDLLTKVEESTRDFIVPDPEEWVDYLKMRRNYHAHGLSRLKVMPGLEENQNLHMRYLIEQTRQLLTVVLAAELGVAPGQLDKYVRGGTLLTHLRKGMDLAIAGSSAAPPPGSASESKPDAPGG